MRTLRSIGFSLLLLGFLFKVMHWPGATASLISGCLSIAMSVVLGIFRDRPTAGEVIRPMGGLLLLVSSLMHSMDLPGGTLFFYGSVLLVAAMLLSDRTRIDLPRFTDLRAPILLSCAFALVMGGFIFKALHWPTAGVQIMIGLTCGIVWMLIPKRNVQHKAAVDRS